MRDERASRGVSRFLASALAVTMLGAGGVALSSACGGRSELEIPPPAPPLPKCVVDADCLGFDNKCRNVRCVVDDGTGGSGSTGTGSATGAGQALTATEGRCVEGKPVDCDDADPCTLDKCNADTGACDYEPASRDNDGDGHNGPREGTQVGDPTACGDDCDDTNDKAFPGNTEVCDGVDNDCNGIVDDNATFVPLDDEPVQISEHATASPGGIAYDGTDYQALFTESRPPPDDADMYGVSLLPTGEKVAPGQQRVTAVNGDSYGGSIYWTGDRYGILWQDRRDDDYEIYFSELDESGNKFLPDTRLSFAPGFSINQDLGFTGNNFVAVWQDERDGVFNIYGRILSLDGTPATENEVAMTDISETAFPNESPVVAASSQGIGVAWARGDTTAHYIRFQRFNFDLSPNGDPLDLTDGFTEAVYPTVVFNHDRYVIAWFDRTASPAGIYAAVVGLDGNVIVPPTSVSAPGAHHSRYPFMRALGDRILLLYADDRDANDGYELYSRVIDKDLSPISAELRITDAAGDSIYPRGAFGPDGDVGVLFRDDRSGEQHVWFTRLGCVTNPTP